LENIKQIQNKLDSKATFQVGEGVGGRGIFHKRTQRITTAIYLVTNFLPTEDPLRLKLRNSSLSLLSLIGSVTFSVHSNLERVIYEIHSFSNEISSMLGIAFYAGYISDMNYQILKRELEFYIDKKSELYNALQNNFILEESDSILENEQMNEQVKKDNIKDKRKGQKSFTPSNRVKIVPSLNESSPVFAKKQSRKELIISVLQSKDQVTVKDISNITNDCSEKTIQRELISLVKTGVLKRNGERRWSTYSLT